MELSEEERAALRADLEAASAELSAGRDRYRTAVEAAEAKAAAAVAERDRVLRDEPNEFHLLQRIAAVRSELVTGRQAEADELRARVTTEAATMLPMVRTVPGLPLGGRDAYTAADLRRAQASAASNEHSVRARGRALLALAESVDRWVARGYSIEELRAAFNAEHAALPIVESLDQVIRRGGSTPIISPDAA